MKITSWNINGFRAIMKKGFVDFLNAYSPDILGLQEIKMAQNVIDKEGFEFPGYKIFWHPAERPGYSGTTTLVREDLEVLSVDNEIGVEEFDQEGRVQILEFKKFYFVNAYFPNSKNDLSRISFKEDFNEVFLKKTKKLESRKPLFMVGDFNVAHQEIDLARPKENVGSPGFTDEEREGMDNFLSAEYLDTFRLKYPKTIRYSWWSYRAGARPRNVGWRLDYVLASKKLKSKIKDAYILTEVMGSDHCPVGVQVNF